MLRDANRRERQEIARKRLSELRDKGFQFVTTDDEGATWIGAESGGIEIDLLLGCGFVGEVRTDLTPICTI